MSSPLQQYLLSYKHGVSRPRLFESPDPQTVSWLVALYRKYEAELIDLSARMQRLHQTMIDRGFRAVFNDVEGELLYLLIRELQPELVCEISPNAGYSTNYLLSAVTRNGKGRIEGFEIIPEFFGRPTDQIIREHFLEICDPHRYHVTIGDARQTVPALLATETPDFVFIDSCHEDFFAEFYVKEVLPRCRGTAFIQDIAHCDPRCEHASEAYYLLAYLQETGSRFLSVASCEGGIKQAGGRERLTPRRPFYSNSVIFTLPSPLRPCASPDPTLAELIKPRGAVGFPTTWSERYVTYPLHALRVFPGCLQSLTLAAGQPENCYIRAWYQGQTERNPPRFSELLALAAGKGMLTKEQEGSVRANFHHYDSFSQVLILEALARKGSDSTALLLEQVKVDAVRGIELPCRLAQVALRLGRKDWACRWLLHGRRQAEPSLVVGYRNLLQCAELFLRIGEPRQAREAFDTALQYINQRAPATRSKASREVFSFCLKHPGFWPSKHVRLHHGQWPYAIVDAGRSVLCHLVPASPRRWLRNLARRLASRW